METLVVVDDNLNIEVISAEPPAKKERRGGYRPGAGRPSLVRENKRRMEMGLDPLPVKKPLSKKAGKKSDAILPMSKKARAQEVLAEMLGRKSKYIVQKVLDKALDDEDEDQMACLKLVMDRVLPADYLAKAKGGSNNISIQIMGVGETTIDGETVENE
jgi:hypothetical protein